MEFTTCLQRVKAKNRIENSRVNAKSMHLPCLGDLLLKTQVRLQPTPTRHTGSQMSAVTPDDFPLRCQPLSLSKPKACPPVNLYKHGICLPPPVVKEILKNHCSSKCPCKTAQSVGYYQILYKFSLSFGTTCSRHLPSFLINFPWKEHYFELTILTGCPTLEAVILTAVARG